MLLGFIKAESAVIGRRSGCEGMDMSTMTTLFCGDVSRTQMNLSDSIVTCVKVINCWLMPRLVSVRASFMVMGALAAAMATSVMARKPLRSEQNQNTKRTATHATKHTRRQCALFFPPTTKLQTRFNTSRRRRSSSACVRRRKKPSRRTTESPISDQSIRFCKCVQQQRQCREKKSKVRTRRRRSIARWIARNDCLPLPSLFTP